MSRARGLGGGYGLLGFSLFFWFRAWGDVTRGANYPNVRLQLPNTII